MAHKQFTAIIEREADGYVALCPEIDVASYAICCTVVAVHHSPIWFAAPLV